MFQAPVEAHCCGPLACGTRPRRPDTASSACDVGQFTPNASPSSSSTSQRVRTLFQTYLRGIRLSVSSAVSATFSSAQDRKLGLRRLVRMVELVKASRSAGLSCSIAARTRSSEGSSSPDLVSLTAAWVRSRDLSLNPPRV